MFTRKPPVLDETRAAHEHRVALVRDMTFEIVPMKNIERAIAELPDGCRVSITCSPVKGIEATQAVAEHTVARGHHVVPHISARLVRDRTHVDELAEWTADLGLDTVFVVGGDAQECGNYPDAESFLRHFCATDHGLSTIGVTGYPDGHPFIDDRKLHEALHAKQVLLAESGIDAYISTQMCFDPSKVSKWLRRERERGLALPVHLGVSGVVDRTKLMTMGVRLGIGASLRYLRKNAGAVRRMMTTASYDPNDLLEPLSNELAELRVTGLHVFTFNQVAATDQWRVATVSEA